MCIIVFSIAAVAFSLLSSGNDKADARVRANNGIFDMTCFELQDHIVAILNDNPGLARLIKVNVYETELTRRTLSLTCEGQ